MVKKRRGEGKMADFDKNMADFDKKIFYTREVHSQNMS